MRLLAFLLFTLVPILAEGPEFEVASIRPFEVATPATAGSVRMNPAGGGPGTNDPTHMTVNAMSIKSIVGMAFDMKSYQVTNADSATDMFNFALVLPAGATRGDVKFMWRNLLVSRFGLKYHIEQREFPVDDLVIGPKGHKLTENTDPPPQPAPDGTLPPPVPPKFENGRVTLNSAAIVTMLKAGPNGVSSTLFAKGQTIGGLISILTNELSHPVIDKTGLTGKYDFTLEYLPNSRVTGEMTARVRGNGDGNAGASPPSPAANVDLPLDLPNALQQQLGLRLVRGKDKLDVVVVDKIEHTPTEN